MTEPARDGTATSTRSGEVEEPWTVLRLIRWSAEYLDGKGVAEGRLDAEHLLAHTLDVTRLQLYLQYDRPLTSDELADYKPLLLRRAAREPLQYVLGTTAFRELELRTDPRALIPRPETEELVGAVLTWAKKRVEEAEEVGSLTALDVGTGSGCIALSLALEGPFGRVVATDPSIEALELARENATRADADEVVELRHGPLYAPVEGERFDVVVSNPPYVAEGERDGMEPEVAEWEPGGALFAGADGLDVVRRLVAGAPAHLAEGGLLALEVAPEQADAVAELIRESESLRDPRVRKDLSGRPRMVLTERR